MIARVLRVKPVVGLADRAGGVGSEAEAAMVLLQLAVARHDGLPRGGEAAMVSMALACEAVAATGDSERSARALMKD